MNEDDTFASLGFESGQEMHMFKQARGGKPVIYLFPPTPLHEVSVQLSLVPSWLFSAVHPPTPVELTKSSDGEDDTQAVSWTVSAEPNGLLTDKATNIEVSYLFWEAM